MLAAGLGEQSAHRQSGVAGADDDGVDGVQGRHDDPSGAGPATTGVWWPARPAWRVGGQPVVTSMETGVGWVSTSYTADLRRDCSTMARSVASSASPSMWKVTLICW